MSSSEDLLRLLAKGTASAKEAGFRVDDFSRALQPAEPPRDAKSRTRLRLLKAAAAHFEKHGYRRTSMDAVAAEAGVAKGTIYVHFKNKSELLFQVVFEEKRRIGARFIALFGEPLTPAERLRRYLELALLSTLDSPLISRLLRGDRELQLWLEEMPAEMRGQLEQAQDAGMQFLLQGVGEFDALPAEARSERAKTLMGVLLMAASMMDPRVLQGLTPQRFAAQLAKIIVDGVGVP